MRKRGVARAYLHNARRRGDIVLRPIIVIGNERPQKRDAQDAIAMT